MLPAFTSIGCYPLLYISAAGTVLCASCATDDDSGETFTPDVHWEGEPICCEGCSWEIDSAYGSEDERTRILVSVKWSYSDDAPITGEVSLVEFLEVQRENLCIEHCEELRALKVGQSKTFGGGDLPTIKVCRLS
jgi:hypothetical protein